MKIYNCGICNVSHTEIFGWQFTRDKDTHLSPWKCFKCMNDEERLLLVKKLQEKEQEEIRKVTCYLQNL